MICRLSSLVNVALLLVGAAQPIAAGSPSGGCGNAPKVVTAAAASTPLTQTSGGKTRQFYVRLPENYDNKHQYRLILTLLALGGFGLLVSVGLGGFLLWFGLPALF